jgi:translation initiation factor 4A
MKIPSHACVGGTAVKDDIRIIQSGVQLVIGTPGRVNDMINRDVLKLDNLRLFCLDEADEMLSRGFKEQIYEIFQYLPTAVQVCLFSGKCKINKLK